MRGANELDYFIHGKQINIQDQGTHENSLSDHKNAPSIEPKTHTDT